MTQSAICYRATAKPDPYWQSFCVYEYKNGKCDYFWDNRNKFYRGREQVKFC